MSTTNTIRVTKSQKFNGIITLLEGGKPVTIPGKDDKAGVTMDADYLCNFLRDELGLLAKKNASTSGNKKLTKTQQANENYKAEILAHMRENPAMVVTATDIYEFLRATHPEEVWSNQRAAALLNAMCDKHDVDTGELISAGKLDRTQGKGKTKTTFQLKPEYVEAE